MKQFICILTFLVFILGSYSFAFGQSSKSDPDQGFRRILTEEKRENWEGNPEYWQFEDGILIGEVPEASPLRGNIFYRWEKEVTNFELKVEYRISSKGNSGIYYRSTASKENENVLLGYQADIDGANTYSGIVYENYEDRGHQILANRGQVIQVSEQDVPAEIGSVGQSEALATKINSDGWNSYHLIVRGDTIIQMLNGQVMCILIDRYTNRVKKGMLGVQLHQGPPMKVEYRNFRFKKLPG
ncbi:DUF1080 domain-containing protein [Halalkalibaculum sp. DA3122]|uniref:3-keto-disaccharide hydrolase n=1 Tax=Halalkalibaculum sp. DA3122 TaxID=3373607 RepID=UPI0037547192